MASEVTTAAGGVSNPRNAVRSNHQIRVFQIDSRQSNESRFAKFMPYGDLKEYGLKFEPSRYKPVFSGEMEVRDLDDVYSQLQGKKPEGYSGHSLSVSDVVVMDGKAYYVDDYGFKKVNKKGFK